MGMKQILAIKYEYVIIIVKCSKQLLLFSSNNRDM